MTPDHLQSPAGKLAYPAYAIDDSMMKMLWFLAHTNLFRIMKKMLLHKLRYADQCQNTKKNAELTLTVATQTALSVMQINVKIS